MKCDKCGYDDNGSGDTAHACTFYQSLSQPVKTPQRPSRSDMTWVGLTDEEIREIMYETGFAMLMNVWFDEHKGNPKNVLRLIEAKLKQKNGYAEEKNNE